MVSAAVLGTVRITGQCMGATSQYYTGTAMKRSSAQEVRLDTQELRVNTQEVRLNTHDLPASRLPARA